LGQGLKVVKVSLRVTLKSVDTFKQVCALLAPYQQGAIFPSPATDESLDTLQYQIGQILPSTLTAVYKVCDGGPEVPGDRLAENLFYSYQFLSTAEMAMFFDGWAHVRRDRHPESFSDPIPSSPLGAVQDCYVSAGWIPFAHDGAGCHLAIDYMPGPNGTVGQVINFGRGDRVHFQLATNFDSFLERVARDYRLKKYHYFFGDTMMFVDRLQQAMT
jgi:cell wall assembly regulator SMI1